ncbi:MAG: hypothetical protein AAF597_01725 [Bacteroidota bacterium]
MKSQLILILMLSFCTAAGLPAQLPYVESFETGSGYTADVDVIDNLSDYFARMNTDCSGPPDPCAANFTDGYSGFDGNFYWAGEDHDDAGVGGLGNPTLCLTLDAIDISANTTGQLEIAIAAAGDNRSNAYDDADDGLFVTYSIDNGPFQAVHTWDYYTPDGGTTDFLAYDSDNDGVIGPGETDVLTPTFKTQSRTITATGNSLVIRICAHSDRSSEEWAVDNIVVTSASPPAPNRVFIGSTGYPTIEAAVQAASNGDVVLITSGAYPENLNLMGKALTIKFGPAPE